MTAVMIWIVYSQIFNFGAAQYHTIKETQQLWKSCIGVMVGSLVVAFPAFKIFMAKGIPPHMVLRFGLVGVFIAMLLLIRWEDPPNEWLFYAAQFCFSAGLLWTFAMLEAFF